MSSPVSDADLAACANEPIHVPGCVQPHGVLLALEPATWTVARISSNAATLLGRPAADLLGVPLADVLRVVPEADLAAVDLTSVNPLSLRLTDGRAVEGVLSRTGGFVVLELEPVAPGDEGFDTSFLRIRSLLQRLQGAATLDALVEVTAQEVRRLTGFDRVMVYRFDPEWNGEVVAEDRRQDLEPFLGLWYPASDIPAQARDLYAATWLRLIAAVDYEPSPILPDATGVDGRPLDLADSALRSVSPVHLEYLRNMGVAASMSISVIVGGRLWGLIACHQQDGPHRPPHRVRVVAELVGQLVSALLPGVEEAGTFGRSMAVRDARGRIADALAAGADPLKVIAERGADVLALAGAEGAAVRVGGRTLLLGRTPGSDLVPGIVAAVRAGRVDEPLAVESVGDEALKDVASGVAVVPVGAGGEQWVAWFRPELLRDVSWGGDPRNKVVREGERISPRRSFERWTETVRLRSRTWEQRELEGAAWFGRHLADVLLRAAAARAEVIDTVQRTLLLESLPQIPGASLCARYAPGAGDAVGGDWYDVFWLPGGRLAVAVGDVAGHGLGVAPAMAQLRHGLRAYLLKEDAPGPALDRLNELVGHLLPEDLASLVVADLDPSTGRMRVANAGHLPPVLVAGAGDARLLTDGRGPALGVLFDHRFQHVEVDLAAGETLLLFTDGLVERRAEGLDAGLERLRLAAAAMAGELEPSCDDLLGLAEGDDDVTLLALRRSA